MFALTNKVAVVTGAASGMGLAIARRFARAGAEVVMLDRADASLTAKELSATFYQVDVTDESSVEEACDAIAERYGRIDVLVNNAGVFVDGSIAATTTEDWEKCFQVNTLGVMYGIKHATRHMPAGGSIINTSSVAALMGFPGYGAYAASKAGAALLTRVAALEYGPIGIRVNAICPASVDTPMLASQANAAEETQLVSVASPIGRIIQPEEIAALVHFLASDDCAALTGTVIPIDVGIAAGYSTALAEAAVASVGTTPRS